MRRIRLKDARIDMVLAADVHNGQDMLLLKKGVALTEKSLRMLKSWGVEALQVQQADGEPADSPDPGKNQAKIEKAMEARFGDTLADPVMAEICRAAAAIVHERNQLS